MRAAALVALLAIACGPVATTYPPVDGDSAFAAEPSGQWRLPPALAEVSGLAAWTEGHVLAHDDERGVVYEIDVANARIGRSASLGAEAATGDFEGVAVDAVGWIWVITSKGRLFRATLDGEFRVVDLAVFDVGLENTCEIEGLAYDRSRDSLTIACKTPYLEDLKDVIALRSWSIADERLDEEAALNIPVQDIARRLGVDSFNASGVDIDPESGRLIVVAARQNALAEFTPHGEVTSVRRLSRLHVQAEGVAVVPGVGLAVADEAGTRDAGRIAIYPRTDDD